MPAHHLISGNTVKSQLPKSKLHIWVLRGFTLVPFPDTVQQTERSKSEHFCWDFGHSALERKSWDKKLDHFIYNFFLYVYKMVQASAMSEIQTKCLDF